MKKWLVVIAEKLSRALKIAVPLIADPKKKIAAAVVSEVLDNADEKKPDNLP